MFENMVFLPDLSRLRVSPATRVENEEEGGPSEALFDSALPSDEPKGEPKDEPKDEPSADPSDEPGVEAPCEPPPPPVEGEPWNPKIHYSLAFTWPASQANRITNHLARRWSDDSQGRSGPSFYFACLLDLINAYKGENVKFSVYMHGELKRFPQLEQKIIAVSDETAIVYFCDSSKPPQFPKMQRLIPVIDSTEDNTVVICIDIHDSPERQRYQIRKFLERMSPALGNDRQLGIATFYPCEGSSYTAVTSPLDPGFALANKAPVMRAQSSAPKRKAGASSASTEESDPPVVRNTMRWYVDAGLIMTTSQGRCALQKAYSIDALSDAFGLHRRTFAEHVEAIGRYAEFLVPQVWDDQWGVEEIALSQYLFAFQPLGLRDRDMLPFKTIESNRIVLEMWKAVHGVFTPYVHTLAERTEKEREALSDFVSLEEGFQYKYSSPTPYDGRSVWKFLDQQEVKKSREKLAKLEGERQIIQLLWNEDPREPKRGSFAAYGPYITSRVT